MHTEHMAYRGEKNNKREYFQQINLSNKHLINLSILIVIYYM